MGYNLDFAVSATVKASIVEEMVKKEVEKQTGRKVKSISFKTREESDYQDRFSTTVFDGCVVYFEDEKETTKLSNTEIWDQK